MREHGTTPSNGVELMPPTQGGKWRLYERILTGAMSHMQELFPRYGVKNWEKSNSHIASAYRIVQTIREEMHTHVNHENGIDNVVDIMKLTQGTGDGERHVGLFALSVHLAQSIDDEYLSHRHCTSMECQELRLELEAMGRKTWHMAHLLNVRGL